MAPNSDQQRSLQEQIVQLRLQLENMATAQATMIDYTVAKTVEREVGERLPPAEHTRWLAERYDEAQRRKRARDDLLVHLLKLGSAGMLGFMAWALWEAIKAKVTGKPFSE